MSEIVVCKLVRLGKDGDTFKKDLIAKELRTNAKVNKSFVDEFNAKWKVKGQMYIIDEDATKLRNETIEKLSKNDELNVIEPKKRGPKAKVNE